MRKIKWLIWGLTAVILTLFLWGDLLNLSTRYLPKVKEAASELYQDEIKPQLSAPEPLRSLKNEPEAFLTRAGIIQWTNQQRERNGLSVIAQNQELNATAAAKVEDMFEKQYFAHVSAEGRDASYFSNQNGYEAIAIGENLALGNFKNDQDLVDAWMNSPGHRANILNSGYQEIGVAVSKGEFEGKTTWLAVQIFGTPRSACPIPSESLRLLVKTAEQELGNLEQLLRQKKSEIDNTPRKDESYNQKVDEYNDLVKKYNAQVEYLKGLINQYNAQVRATNECIANF